MSITENKTFFPSLFFFIVFICTVFFHFHSPPLDLESERLTHLHFHIAQFRINAEEERFSELPVGKVYFDGERVTGVGGEAGVSFIYDPENGIWDGIFPIPWSAPNGFYTLQMEDGTSIRFLVKSRLPFDTRGKKYKVMNLESTRRISSINYPLPNGERAGFSSIFDWTKYVGGNTLWYLAGQTASYNPGDIDIDFPWLKTNVQTLEEFASAAKESGLDFGAWVICYRTFGLSRLKPEQYSYSMNYRGGRIVESDGISINDQRRLSHIKEFVSRLNEMEDIDYIGLDYIRPTGGGFELVDDFVRAMRINVSENFFDKSKEERMAWLGAIVARQTNRDFEITEKWNWWRAHRMSLIINDIRESVEIKKPLWAFVLSWEMGRQHGQDPIMFTDAGIDILSIMMYETDARRFNHLIRDWERGTEGFNLNLMPGNQIDWPLHQFTVYPSGPEEFYRRIESSVEHLSTNVRGVFINDISRAFGGRRGPYNYQEWLMSCGRAFNLADDLPLRLHIDIPYSKSHGESLSGVLRIENPSKERLNDLKVEFPIIPGVRVIPEKKSITHIDGETEKELGFTVSIEGAPSRRMGRYMVAARVLVEDTPHITYSYIWLQGHPPDSGWYYR